METNWLIVLLILSTAAVVSATTTQAPDSDGCKQMNPKVCSQGCISHDGGYDCYCQEGYTLINNTYCRAIGPDPLILFADRYFVYRYDPLKNEYRTIAYYQTNAVALDYDIKKMQVYWSDVVLDEIYRTDINGTALPEVVITGANIPDGICIDWVYRNMYWTDTGTNTIEVASIEDPSKRTILISDNLDEPRAITIDPRIGYMFWSDWGQAAKIERAGMNGMQRLTLVDTDIHWPNGLTTDLISDHLFWVDGRTHSLSSIDYNGQGRRTILQSDSILPHPFGITVFEDYVYMTDWQIKGIIKANKFNGNHTILVDNLYSPAGIQIYHPQKQINGIINHCEGHNGGCSDLCVAAPDVSDNSAKYSCLCPTNSFLMQDGRTCFGSTRNPLTPPPAATTGPPEDKSTTQMRTESNIDNQNPVVTCPDDINFVTTHDQSTTAVSWPNPTVTDNVDDNNLSATCTPSSGSSFSVGSTVVTCSATDTAGNRGSCSFNVEVNDNQIPVVTCPDDFNLVTTHDQSTAAVSWPDPTVTDNVDNNNLSATCTPSSGSSFSVVSTLVTCSATDTAGNRGSCSFNVEVNDITNPIVTCPDDINLATTSDQSTVAVSWPDPTVTDNFDKNNLSATCIPSSGSSFSVGSTVVNCSATDTAGYIGSCSFNVEVNDNQNPVVTCPDDINLATTSDQSTAAVSWPDPTVTDNVDNNNLSATCTPYSGSSFSVGSTVVTCSATDTAGNRDSCSFNVEVNDITNPIVTCPDDINLATTSDQSTVAVSWPDPTVTDNFDKNNLSATCIPSSGSSFSVGSTVVNCSATDTAGYIGSCSFNVEVNDNQNPVVTCPDDINLATTSDQSTTAVSWPDPTVTDNVDNNNLSVTCTPYSGSLFSVGATVVTCSATDSAGNRDSCSFNVEVNDNASSVPDYLIAVVAILCVVILVISPALTFFCRSYYSQKKNRNEHSKEIIMHTYDAPNPVPYEAVYDYETVLPTFRSAGDAAAPPTLESQTRDYLAYGDPQMPIYEDKIY